MHVVGHDVVEQALIVGDDDDAARRVAQRVDAVGHRAQRVDVEAEIGLVQDAQARLEHRHLQDLVALLLAAREAEIEVALSSSSVTPTTLALRAAAS